MHLPPLWPLVAAITFLLSLHALRLSAWVTDTTKRRRPLVLCDALAPRTVTFELGAACDADGEHRKAERPEERGDEGPADDDVEGEAERVHFTYSLNPCGGQCFPVANVLHSEQYQNCGSGYWWTPWHPQHAQPDSQWHTGQQPASAAARRSRFTWAFADTFATALPLRDRGLRRT